MKTDNEVMKKGIYLVERMLLLCAPSRKNFTTGLNTTHPLKVFN